MSDAKTDAKAIFLEALECKGADELRSFLDQACGANAVLRGRVEELLRAHQDAGALLGGAEQQDLTRDQFGAERPGTVIGHYKLLEQIGEGGFGVVFMAEQMQPVRRKVALKVLKPGMDTRQVVASLEAAEELTHPAVTAANSHALPLVHQVAPKVTLFREEWSCGTGSSPRKPGPPPGLI